MIKVRSPATPGSVYLPTAQASLVPGTRLTLESWARGTVSKTLQPGVHELADADCGTATSSATATTTARSGSWGT
jgi:hypothetical protein